MNKSSNKQAFFELLRGGLWERDVRFSNFKDNDYSAIMRLAEEQSVVGLITAGLEHVVDVTVPKEVVLQFVGSTLQIERRNKAMNEYVARLIEKLRHEDIYAILVKGQGIAQCYEKPLWRCPGDVDLFLSDTNYEKAKNVLVPQAVDVESEYKSFKHLGMTMKGGYVVELHGTMHSRLSKRVDMVIDEAQKDCFFAGNVRSEEFKDSKGSRVQVFLPSPDNDVIFVFTHILHHFFIEGVGLRQICDWCRLLWRYQSEIDLRLLEKRLREAGLMSEWKAFAALAVDWLGMPVEVMPLYDSRFKVKDERILEFVLKTGNFGHNREREVSKSYMGSKLASTFRKLKDFGHHMRIFPIDSLKFFCYFAIDGIGGAMRGE